MLGGDYPCGATPLHHANVDHQIPSDPENEHLTCQEFPVHPTQILQSLEPMNAMQPHTTISGESPGQTAFPSHVRPFDAVHAATVARHMLVPTPNFRLRNPGSRQPGPEIAQDNNKQKRCIISSSSSRDYRVYLVISMPVNGLPGWLMDSSM